MMTKNLPRQFHLQASFIRPVYFETENKNKMNTQQVILILRASFDMMISYLQLHNFTSATRERRMPFKTIWALLEKQQTWQVNLSPKKINHKPLQQNQAES